MKWRWSRHQIQLRSGGAWSPLIGARAEPWWGSWGQSSWRLPTIFYFIVPEYGLKIYIYTVCCSTKDRTKSPNHQNLIWISSTPSQIIGEGSWKTSITTFFSSVNSAKTVKKLRMCSSRFFPGPYKIPGYFQDFQDTYSWSPRVDRYVQFSGPIFVYEIH